MGDIKNLQQQEAISKIKELAEKIGTCMFCTDLTRIPFTARPMSTTKVDEAGAVWFFSHKSSDKNAAIAKDNRVQLLYSNMGSIEFLSLYGTAQIITDKAKAKELWTPIAKAWFEQGVDDPDLSLLKIVPEEGHYWDTKHGKIVALTNILIAAVTGKTMDDGVEGNLTR